MAKSRDKNAADLKSPLLLNHHHHQQPPPPAPSPQELIINVESQGPNNEAQPPSADSSNPNPFDFLGISGELLLPRPSSVDPFRNHTPGTGGVYEWLKILVVIPLALARLAIFVLALVVGYLATKLALGGWKDRTSPMPRWRCRVMWVTRISSRCILFSFGYQWIKRIGRPAPREIAPIVVSNHISYIEPIFFFYELFPTIVASESHDSLPLVGVIIRAMQVIYVDRFSAGSRKHAVSEIKRKASCNDFPRVLLFPEGTTTNGRSLISFQLGAFVPGFPVQPVIVRYPYVHFDQSWGYISLARLMFRMFTQFHNFMEVEYLPIIEPLEGKESVVQFAERTSYAMASALNVVQTSHSYGDIMLLTRASEISKEKYSTYMIEMASAENAFNITTSEAMEFLDQFFAMHPDANGRVKIDDFLMAYGLANTQFFEKIFNFLDVEKKGSITFRQFLLGSAYIRKQPSFWSSCETAFGRCCDENGAMSPTLNKLGEIIQLSMPNISNATVHQLFHLLDIDDDGTISRDDFMACLRKNPLLISFFAPCLR